MRMQVQRISTVSCSCVRQCIVASHCKPSVQYLDVTFMRTARCWQGDIISRSKTAPVQFVRQLTSCAPRRRQVLTWALCSRAENYNNLRQPDDGGSAVAIGNPATAEFQVCRTTLLAGAPAHDLAAIPRLQIPLLISHPSCSSTAMDAPFCTVHGSHQFAASVKELAFGWRTSGRWLSPPRRPVQDSRREQERAAAGAAVRDLGRGLAVGGRGDGGAQ